MFQIQSIGKYETLLDIEFSQTFSHPWNPSIVALDDGIWGTADPFVVIAQIITDVVDALALDTVIVAKERTWYHGYPTP